MFSFVFDFFQKKRCYVCGQSGHNFCLSCQIYISYKNPQCYLCKKHSDNFLTHENCQTGHFPLSVYILFPYSQKGISTVLKDAKYYKRFHLYREILLFGKKHLESHLYLRKQNSLLIPVPMHFLRKWKRGANHSEYIAQELGNILGIPVYKKMITRKKNTGQQARLSKNQREKNLSGAFQLRSISNIPKDTVLYLVDDVVSSGSTFREITILLQEAGFMNIHAIALASN